MSNPASALSPQIGDYAGGGGQSSCPGGNGGNGGESGQSLGQCPSSTGGGAGTSSRGGQGGIRSSRLMPAYQMESLKISSDYNISITRHRRIAPFVVFRSLIGY